MKAECAPRLRVTIAFLSVLFAALGVGTAAAVPASAEATVSNEVSFLPTSGGFLGCGEFILYSGTIRVAFRNVTDASGGSHIEDFQSNWQGVSGTADSGVTYRFVGGWWPRNVEHKARRGWRRCHYWDRPPSSDWPRSDKQLVCRHPVPRHAQREWRGGHEHL